MNTILSDDFKKSRLLYTIEAALEYLISILVAGSFLATLTKELGFSDSLTGIMSSIISLGCLFQLLSLSIRRYHQKRFVTTLSIINQILFLLLYAVPLTNFNQKTKTVIFIILIFSAYIIYNLAHPKKISWLMSFVEDHHRGRFTANKEIISLLSGMIFSFAMGSVVDHFTEIGKTRIAFIISAAVIFVLMVSHSLTMIFSAETPTPPPSEKNFKGTLKELLRNKNLLHVTLVFVLYYISTYISTPFFATYQINELGLSLKFITAITMCGSISRIAVSRFWGRYADKNSFAVMIEKCLIFLAASNVCVVFASPSNGAIMFVLYYILHGIALGGINSALMNMIFDYIPPEKRADSLAITQAFAGLTGFLTTLCISPLVSFIQNSGNKILGVNIYAQQFVSLLAFVTLVLAILFVRYFIIKGTQKVNNDDKKA